MRHVGGHPLLESEAGLRVEERLSEESDAERSERIKRGHIFNRTLGPWQNTVLGRIIMASSSTP